jgi:predicted transcriptional regulator
MHQDSTTISVELTNDLKSRLDTELARTGVPLDRLVKQAVADYLDSMAWRRQALEKGVQQLDAGDWVSHAEARSMFRSSPD